MWKIFVAKLLVLHSWSVNWLTQPLIYIRKVRKLVILKRFFVLCFLKALRLGFKTFYCLFSSRT